ncbi:serine/threonine-protein_kinase (plasmid) [Leishmania braziliensis MHOM/BR/75/M2904]|nr:serine/threonine-protein_kinase [Leishmania braziliensis MHOM/BR/75/M2904]
MLRWATQVFGEMRTTATAATDTSDTRTGEAAAHQQQLRHSRHGPDVPPLKRWWTSADAEDASASAVRPSSPASPTPVEGSMDDGYCSPGVLDLAASLKFSMWTAVAAASDTTSAMVGRSASGEGASAESAAHARSDEDEVDDFLKSIIAGKTDILRKQLAQRKLEAAAAAANAGSSSSSNNSSSSPTSTRGGGAGLHKSISRNSASMTDDGSAFTGSGAYFQKPPHTAAATTGSPLTGDRVTTSRRGSAGGASHPQQQPTRRSRYVSSAARSLQDYELIAFLGSGTFAEVTLARNKVTKEYFAVKKISKQRVKEEGCVERTFTERQLLAKLHHPFLVRLYQAFQSQTHLYLVLDFAQGGDLYYLNMQQLWLRSMRRRLAKMQYPYYQCASNTVTPVLVPIAPVPGRTGAAAATAESNAQQQQPKTSLPLPLSLQAGGSRLTTGLTLRPLSLSSATTQPPKATLNPQPQQPSGSNGTTTTERDALPAPSAMVGGLGPDTVSGASQSGIAATSTTTGTARPLPPAQDGYASGMNDDADDAVAAVTKEEEGMEDMTASDGAIGNNDSLVDAPPFMVMRRQEQQGRPSQRGVAGRPNPSPRIAAGWPHCTADTVDEVNFSCRGIAVAFKAFTAGGEGSRSSPTSVIIPSTSEVTGLAAMEESTPAATRDTKAASSPTPAAVLVMSKTQVPPLQPPMHSQDKKNGSGGYSNNDGAGGAGEPLRDAGGTDATNVKKSRKTPSSAHPSTTEAMQKLPLASDNSRTATPTRHAVATSPTDMRTQRGSSSRGKMAKANLLDDRGKDDEALTSSSLPLSASTTTTSFAGATAGQGAAPTPASLGVNLATSFHQAAMEGSTGVLPRLLSAELAPDGGHRFPLRLIAFYAVEVALVLQYLHREGFLYRDLKPENILMRGDGHVMLTDFGVAKYRKGAAIIPSASGDGVNGEDATNSSSAVGTGADGRANSFTGTTQYMSPEMLRGQPHDSRTDWWSYGCLLFEWANGRKAFDAQNQFALFRSIVEEDVKITPEDYRLTPLEVHTRVAQLHYRTEEVRLECEEWVARRLRRSFTSPLQRSRSPSTFIAEVVYNPDNRSFDVLLRSPAMSTRSAQPGIDGSFAATEGPEGAVANNSVSSSTPHRHAYPRLHNQGYASPQSPAASVGAPTAAMLDDSFASQLGTLRLPNAAGAEDDPPGPPPKLVLNDSLEASSFVATGFSSSLSLCGAPTNLSMHLTTTEDGATTALRQQEQQERYRHHQRRRLRLSCLTLDEATRDRYVGTAVAQMDEAQALLRDLTVKLLDRRVEHRLSGEAVLEHPFFTCSYIASQLYYEVYQRRVLPTELRRLVRASLGPTSPTDPVASTWDEALQQSITPSSPLPSTSTAAAASPVQSSFLPVPLQPPTRPEDWRQLFMERRIRAPYTPRLRTRDDLRYFPSAVTATGLSAAVEQHRRIKQVKEQQRELMMMRANKAAAAVMNSSLSGGGRFTPTLPSSRTQVPANSSGGGGGFAALQPLDAEAAQQLPATTTPSNSLSAYNYDGASHLPALNPNKAAAADISDVKTTRGASQAATAPAARSQGPTEVLQSLQLPPVEVMVSVTADLGGAAPSPRRPADVSAQSPAACDARRAGVAKEAQLDASPVQHPLLHRHSGALPAYTGETAAGTMEGVMRESSPLSSTPTTTPMTATRRVEGERAEATASLPYPSRATVLPLAERYSTEMASSCASPEDTPPSAGRVSSAARGGAAADGVKAGNGGAMTTAVVEESPSDLFDRAATLPQSFVDAALAVAAAAQKKQQRSVGPTAAPGATAAAAESPRSPAPTDVARSTGADASALAAALPTSLGAPPLPQQQQPARVDFAAPGCSVLSAGHGMAYAADDGADARLGRILPKCGGIDAHSVTGAEIHAEEVVDEDEDHDGGGGYYEQDAFAEDDAHVVDAGDATVVEEVVSIAERTTASNSATATVIASAMDASSCDDSHVSARTVTPMQQATMFRPSTVCSSAGTSEWGNSAANPLSPNSGGGVDGKVNNAGSRGNMSPGGLFSLVPIEVPPTANVSLSFSSHTHSLLDDGATRPMHDFLKETPVHVSPLLSRGCEEHCSLSGFAASSVSSMATMPFDDLQRSLSASLGTSGADGADGTSSMWAMSSPTDPASAERGHQRRGHHNPLLDIDSSESQGGSDTASHALPSLTPGEQHHQQQQQLLSALMSVVSPLSPAGTTSDTVLSGEAADVLSCATVPTAVQRLADTRVSVTSGGGAEAPPESLCDGRPHGTNDARSGCPQTSAAFPDVGHRGAHPSRATAASITQVASMSASNDGADDGETTTTGSSSERVDGGKSGSDVSGLGNSAGRPVIPVPASTWGGNVADDARHSDSALSLLGSSVSSISTTTSTSAHTFSMSSGASSINSETNSDTAVAADAGAAAMYHTTICPSMVMLAGDDRRGAGGLSGSFGSHNRGGATSLSPYGTLPSLDAGSGGHRRRHGNGHRIPHWYAHLGGDAAHGGVGTTTPFAATDEMVENPTLGSNPTASVLSLFTENSGSTLFGTAAPSAVNLSTTGSGTGDAAVFWGPLTTTLSGVAYNVDDEASMGTFPEMPVTPLSSCDGNSGSAWRPSFDYSGRGQGGKDAIGSSSSRGSGGPSGTSERRGVQALWAQQQRKRIARGLQQQQQQQPDLSPVASLLLHGADTESGRRGTSDSGDQQWYGTKRNPSNATIFADRLVGFTSDDGGAGQPLGRRRDSVVDQPEPRQPSLGIPYRRSVGDDGAAQRQSSSPQSGGEQSRSHNLVGMRGYQNSSLTNSDNQGGADGRTGATSGGGDGGGGGLDHFQNFSFTSPQILQQYLASSSFGGGGSGDREGRLPHYQRPRRGRLDGGGADRDS